MVYSSYFNCNNALGIITVRACYALREDCCGRISACNGNTCRKRCDACKFVSCKHSFPCLTDSGNRRNVKLYTRQYCIVRFDIEIAGFACYIAIAILQIECNRMHSFAEVHKCRCAAKNVHLILAAIYAVKVEVSGFYTCSKKIRFFVVIICNKES